MGSSTEWNTMDGVDAGRHRLLLGLAGIFVVAALVLSASEAGAGGLAEMRLTKGVSCFDLDGSGDLSVGDTCDYTITAENVGTEPLTSVEISDPFPFDAPLDCVPSNPADLPSSGDTLVCTGTHTAVPADVGTTLTNTATATSNELAPLEVTLSLELGVIEIIKDAVPDDPQDFSFSMAVGPTVFALDDDADPTLGNSRVFVNVFPGTYSVTEAAVPGWDTSIQCVDPTGDTTAAGSTATIRMDQGETITCVFTNNLVGSPDITVQKFVGYLAPGDVPVWTDANTPPGVERPAGSPIWFGFLATNTGAVPLTDIDLSDPLLDFAIDQLCVIPGSLAPGGSFVCIVGAFGTPVGQTTNTATASGAAGGVTVTDSDDANVFGQFPFVAVKKYVGFEAPSPTWVDAQTGPGPELVIGSDVYFGFQIGNLGNVPIEDVSLTDSVVGAAIDAQCSIPTVLAPGEIVTCITGPFSVEEGQHANLATATATFQGGALEATDPGNYFGGD